MVHQDQGIDTDLVAMEEKLKVYIDNGRIPGGVEVGEEPVVGVRPDVSLIKPLKRLDAFAGSFVAVDCSTRTLRRANNWGIYLMRPACALVSGREVDWSYQERLYTAVGDARTRSNLLTDARIELESLMALSLLQGGTIPHYYEHADTRSNYMFLDGGGYFGGERKFRVSLYEVCEKERVNLLAISKNSPSLHDERGRDLIATTSILSPYDIWVYHPIKKADKDRSLYGDIALVKLCRDSRHVFRCDIMDYLTDREISELLSPLTCLSEDPRCVGYPVALWLAHEFSRPSDSMLLSYYDQTEKSLSEAGLLEALRREESSCSFADELHGIRHAFNWEWWSGQF